MVIPESRFADIKTEKNLKMIGRGIMNHKGEVLVLVCVGERLESNDRSCLQLRHAKISTANGEIEFLGGTHIMDSDHEPSRKELKSAANRVAKMFKNFERNDPENKMKHFRKMYIGLSCGILCGGLAISNLHDIGVITAASIASLGVVAGIAVPASMTVIGIFTIKSPLWAVSEKGGRAIRNQEGWNWSHSPKKTSDKSFEMYLRYVDGTAQAVQIP